MPAADFQQEDTRTLVLGAALRLFTEQGYFNTSVHDVGRTAGVSIGSIYHHFGDKEGLARTLYAALTTRMQHLIEDVVRMEGSSHDQARELVARLFAWAEAEPWEMAFLLYARHREFLPDEAPICSSRPFVMMREMISRGIARGEIRQMDVMVASASLFGGPIRMITTRLDGILPHPLPGYLDEVWDCAWRAVAAPRTT
ncbi:MAG: TetR/AcrR family transcriptional regulator [Proteobacteria bacterium]|nr:TetR/AcrR family transcriptional regulator [Pseudomonadota bacterium]